MTFKYIPALTLHDDYSITLVKFSSAALTGAVSVITLERCSICLLFFLGLQG